MQEIAGGELSHQIPLGYQPPVRPVPFGLIGGNK
jgi:hypothetical protein